MLRLFLISLILFGTLPAMADDVVVKRQKHDGDAPVKIENIQPKPNVKPLVKSAKTEQDIANDVKYIKQEMLKQAKKWIPLSDNNMDKRVADEYCNFKGYLEGLGAQNISFEIVYPEYFKKYKTFVIDGKTYKNPHKCLKFKFTYLGKPYETGVCKGAGYSSGGIVISK